MVASLVTGAYRLLAVFESSSSQDIWYRTLQNELGSLSCDCPAWIFTKGGARTCLHTEFMEEIQNYQHFSQLGSNGHINNDALLRTMNSWWHNGLQGDWTITSRIATFKRSSYLFIQTELTLGTGQTVSCLIAFANRHLDMTRVYERTAGWCGYTIAADVARLGGFPLAGQQPEHFKVPKSTKKTQRGLSSFLRLAEQVDLGDGLRPEQRAEETLQFFLGEILYTQLETNHFLDVSSYLTPDRVYRLRRDYPRKQRERRVRVFEHGIYVKDFCIVRDQAVPEADWYLGTFLGLLSNEEKTISVVKSYNIFPTHSDDGYSREKEVIPTIWQSRSIRE